MTLAAEGKGSSICGAQEEGSLEEEEEGNYKRQQSGKEGKRTSRRDRTSEVKKVERTFDERDLKIVCKIEEGRNRWKTQAVSNKGEPRLTEVVARRVIVLCPFDNGPSKIHSPGEASESPDHHLQTNVGPLG
eukprot:Gb_38645 [translate_table: standard]